ncbi:MAG TPA: hypothetical protein VF519_06540 [Mycobacteriales bacterium]|jgi:hypothetical protein
MQNSPRLSGRHIVTIVVAVCAAVVLAPVGVMAATGTLVNITDPVNSANRARVTSAGSMYSSLIDQSTRSVANVDSGKLRVGDGSGALSVDGTVSSRSLDTNALVYKSPTGGLNCGADGSGLLIGTYDLSRYSRLRIAVKSGVNNQTIIQFRAKAGTETILQPWLDWTVPAAQYGHNVFYDPPTSSELRIFFCASAQVFIYGLR